jgi:putative hemolysin
MSAFAIVIGILLVAVLTLGTSSVRAVSRLWLRHWIEHQAGGVGAMQRYLERPTRLVHAAGTASMLVVFAVGSIIAMDQGLRAWAFVRDVTLFVLLLLVFGQLLPRAIGRRWAPQLVPITVPMLRLIDVAVTPFQWLSGGLRGLVSRPPQEGSPEEMRDGLEELLRDGTFSNIGATEEMAIISGVVQFGDKRVRDVMTPRDQLFALSNSLPPAEFAGEVAQSGYSRIPVYGNGPDDIVGMVHVFDVFRRGGESIPDVRPVPLAAADKPAKDLLFELLRSRRQVAIVQDGTSVVGLVTLEDLLEELVGDIRDEHDDSTD